MENSFFILLSHGTSLCKMLEQTLARFAPRARKRKCSERPLSAHTNQPVFTPRTAAVEPGTRTQRDRSRRRLCDATSQPVGRRGRRAGERASPLSSVRGHALDTGDPPSTLRVCLMGWTDTCPCAGSAGFDAHIRIRSGILQTGRSGKRKMWQIELEARSPDPGRFPSVLLIVLVTHLHLPVQSLRFKVHLRTHVGSRLLGATPVSLVLNGQS